MAEYDLGRMQEEAVRRAKEMQSRARVPPPARPPRARPPPAAPPPPQKDHGPPAPPAAPPPQEDQGPPAPPAAPATALDALFQDKERTLLLALLVLLSSEDASHDLLFALLFLLL